MVRMKSQPPAGKLITVNLQRLCYVDSTHSSRICTTPTPPTDKHIPRRKQDPPFPFASQTNSHSTATRVHPDPPLP
eukprot:10855-Eustigmatos_ZCMA.PRE.1